VYQQRLTDKKHDVYNRILEIQDLPDQGSLAPLLMAQATDPQATRINPGVDPDLGLKGPALDAEIRRLSELARSMPNDKERQKLQRKINELRARKSRKAHSADKFSLIPIIPEAPLAADAGVEVGEAFEGIEVLIELSPLLAL
jgi:hypothetical protein